MILTQETGVTAESGPSLYDVKYTVGCNLSQNVIRERIDIAMIGTTARRQSANDELRPSLLSNHHRPRMPQAMDRHPTPRHTRNSLAWLLALASSNERLNHERKVIAVLRRKKRMNQKVGCAGWKRRLIHQSGTILCLQRNNT